MAISDKTRKMLWARSGNRCAICKTELVLSKEALVADVIIGVECHIVSAKQNGPRHTSLGDVGYDDHTNLMLLCSIHHKIVDDAPDVFSAEGLHMLKGWHEDWVRATLQRDAAAFANPDLHIQSLARLATGKQVLDVVASSHAFQFDYPDSLPDNEIQLIGGVLQDIQDYGDLFSGSEVLERVTAAVYLNDRIKELKAIGIELFGGERTMKFKSPADGKPFDWEVAIVLAVKDDHPAIVGDFLISTMPKKMRPF